LLPRGETPYFRAIDRRGLIEVSPWVGKTPSPTPAWITFLSTRSAYLPTSATIPRCPMLRSATWCTALVAKHKPVIRQKQASKPADAHCADRRDAKGQMSLFTTDTHFVVYMNAKDPTPSQELHSREALAPVFADLNKYAATTHFVGQSTIFTLTGDRAKGEAYCLAHHVTVDGAKRSLMLASLRYLDTFVKMEDAWLFAERLLYVDWMEERPLS